MHPLTRAAAQEAAALEFRQFQDPDDRERVNEVRALVLGFHLVPEIDYGHWKALGIFNEQVPDDHPSTAGRSRDRIGDANTGWVGHGDPDLGESLWRRWTPDQMALEDAFAPLLDMLPPQQREVIHLMFWGRLTFRQTALVMHVKSGTVQSYHARALANLRRAIEARYPLALAG